MTGWKKCRFIGWESLASGLFQVGMFMCLSLIMGLPAGSQEKSLMTGSQDLQGKSAQGQLTVTATIVSSVGIVIGPNGERVLVVANTPAANDNLTAMSAVRLRDSAHEEQAEERKNKQQGP